MAVLGSCVRSCRSVGPGDVAGRIERFDAVHAVALVRDRIVPWVNLRGRAQRHRLLVEKIWNRAVCKLDECRHADRKVADCGRDESRPY